MATDPHAAAILAAFDQTKARARAILDERLFAYRTTLAGGIPPDIALGATVEVFLNGYGVLEPLSRGQLADCLAVAIDRLARIEVGHE